MSKEKILTIVVGIAAVGTIAYFTVLAPDQEVDTSTQKQNVNLEDIVAEEEVNRGSDYVLVYDPVQKEYKKLKLSVLTFKDEEETDAEEGEDIEEENTDSPTPTTTPSNIGDTVTPEELADLSTSDLTDVSDNTPSEGQVLVWDAGTNQWKPATLNVPEGGTIDEQAVHVDEAGEIAALTEKGTPAGTDFILIEDSEDNNTKKKIQIGNLPTGSSISDIDDLGDVDTSTSAPTNGQVLVWDLVNSEWVPGDLPASGATSANELSDVDTSTIPPTAGQVLVWDDGASEWVPGDLPSAGASAIDDLSDVDTSSVSPTDGQSLVWNNATGEWEPQTIVSDTGVDTNAIHDNVSGEISSLAEKATPVAGDLILIEDSENSNTKKYVQVGSLPTGATSADELSDVDTSSVAPTDGQALVWDNVGAKWIPGDLPSGGASAIDDLSDVDTTSSAPTDGQSLVWNDANSAWEPATIVSDTGVDTSAIHDNVSGEISVITEKATPVAGDFILIEDSEASNAKKRIQVGSLPTGATSADELSDVDTTSSAPTDGQALIWDNATSKWVPGDLPSAGATSLDELSDVDVSSSAPTYKQSLLWDPDVGKFIPGNVPYYTGVPSENQVLQWGPSGLGENKNAGTNSYSYYSGVNQRDIPIYVKRGMWVNSFTSYGFSHRGYIWQIKDFDTGTVLASTNGGAYEAGNQPHTFSLNSPFYVDPGYYKLSMLVNGSTDEWILQGAPFDYEDMIVGTDGNDIYAPVIVNYYLHDYGTGSWVDNELNLLSDVDTSSVAPTDGQSLVWNDANSAWEPATIVSDTGVDTSAIHDNVSGEISVITEKATPVAGDFILIEDSEASNAKKRIQVGSLPTGATSADELSDVDTTSSAPTDGQALVWDNAGSKWVPGDLPSAGASAIDDLSDVDTTSNAPTDGQSLVWDSSSSQWIPGDVSSSGGGDATSIQGVTVAGSVATPNDGDILEYSNSGLLYGADVLDGSPVDDGTSSSSYSSQGSDYVFTFSGRLAIKEINAYFYTTNNVTVTIQPDEGGLALYTETFSVTSGQNSLVLSTPFELTSGTRYFINFNFQNNMNRVKASSNSGTYYTAYGAHTGDPLQKTQFTVAEILGIDESWQAVSNDLDRLSDVDTSTSAPTDGQSLVWDNAASKWEPGTPNATDTSALHDNVSGEISLITEKATPVDADLLVIEDSADSNNKKKIQIGNLPFASAINELSDVDTSSTPPTDGQALVWDDVNSKWVPGDIASGGGIGVPILNTGSANQALIHQGQTTVGDGNELEDGLVAGSSSSSSYNNWEQTYVIGASPIVLNGINYRARTNTTYHFDLYDASNNLIAQTYSVSADNAWVRLDFPSPVVLQANETYRTELVGILGYQVYYNKGVPFVFTDYTITLGDSGNGPVTHTLFYERTTTSDGAAWQGIDLDLLSDVDSTVTSSVTGQPLVWNAEDSLWEKGNIWVAAPITSTDTCTTGQRALDSDYVYYCVESNTWKRAGLSTW